MAAAAASKGAPVTPALRTALSEAEAVTRAKLIRQGRMIEGVGTPFDWIRFRLGEFGAKTFRMANAPTFQQVLQECERGREVLVSINNGWGRAHAVRIFKDASRLGQLMLEEPANGRVYPLTERAFNSLERYVGASAGW